MINIHCCNNFQNYSMNYGVSIPDCLKSLKQLIWYICDIYTIQLECAQNEHFKTPAAMHNFFICMGTGEI